MEKFKIMKFFFFAISIFCSLSLIVFSCTPQQQIERTFNKIKSAESSADIIDWLDQESINYLKKIGELAVKHEYEAVGQFCYNSPTPLSTRYLLGALNFLGPSDTTVVIELEEVLRTVSFMNFGLFGEESRKMVRFLNTKEVKGDHASAEISFKVAKNVNIKSVVNFNLEDGRWKLNFPSTLTYPEKYFNNLWRQRGGNLQEFIQGVVENGGETVNWMVVPK